jgi:outer membrane protein assembly factor BamB/DNA-directed RNA polymerase subunit RPC12/RpoP
MKAIQVKCGSCGAGLDVGEDQEWVSCAYCGTRSRIQRRTREFKRIGHSELSRSGEPVAVEQPAAAGGKTISVAILLPVLLGAGVGLYFFLGGGGGGGLGMQWEGVGRALLADVNGDGAPDPIGRTRYVGGSDSVHLAAVDAASGEIIWESEPLGTYTETYQGRVYLAGRHLLYASQRGELWALRLADGKRLWRVPLGEKVASMCQPGPERVLVRTEDEQLHRIRLADGTAERDPAGQAEPGDCRPLSHDRRDGDVRIFDVDRWAPAGFDPEPEGMYTSDRYRLDDDGPYVVTGTNKPGTRVPMVAVYAPDRSLRWKSEVPGRDRLAAKETDPEVLTFDAQRLYVVYAAKESNRAATLAAFAMDDGRRLWESRLPSSMPVSSVVAAEDMVWVTTWGRLTAFGATDGGQVYSIGSSPK